MIVDFFSCSACNGIFSLIKWPGRWPVCVCFAVDVDDRWWDYRGNWGQENVSHIFL